MHYSADVNISFDTVRHIRRDVNYGWLLRIMHANGARLFFACLFVHIARGVYYQSYYFTMVWGVGVALLLRTMAAAFLGYVLPWGQISFWGATVITSLFSAIPFIGGDLTSLLWGGFAVDNATLTRFFAFHFLVPFLVAAIAIIHLLFLHQSGSNNSIGLPADTDKIAFHPYFTSKDIIGLFLLFFIWILGVFQYPWILGDPENFIEANPLVTPVHIQPEWYFLFAYAILRAIPNKLGGVIALAIAVLILLYLPFTARPNFNRLTFYYPRKFFFWTFVGVFLLLTWIGARPVEEPFILIGQIFTIIYFSFFFIFNNSKKYWDSILT